VKLERWLLLMLLPLFLLSLFSYVSFSIFLDLLTGGLHFAKVRKRNEQAAQQSGSGSASAAESKTQIQISNVLSQPGSGSQIFIQSNQKSTEDLNPDSKDQR